MEKIEIKLKECCLTCEHFDQSGIKGLSWSGFSCCGEPERVIACGHMAVCKTYLEDKKAESFWTRIEYRNKKGGCYKVEWECEECGGHSMSKSDYCPLCGAHMTDGKA